MRFHTMRLGKKFLVIFILKKFGKKSKGLFFTFFVLEIILSWIEESLNPYESVDLIDVELGRDL